MAYILFRPFRHPPLLLRHRPGTKYLLQSLKKWPSKFRRASEAPKRAPKRAQASQSEPKRAQASQSELQSELQSEPKRAQIIIKSERRQYSNVPLGIGLFTIKGRRRCSNSSFAISSGLVTYSGTVMKGLAPSAN